MAKGKRQKAQTGQQGLSAPASPRLLTMEVHAPAISSWKTRLGAWLEDKLERLARSS